ncbi:GyrI-like domain-containing protein [Cohnella terricola]|uniref:GyrI-like domain-containing protein n=1 Tax=Cohnella terricola TaxID=1289167 RepID=A0A559J8Y7_9BACL|nr:GyrI-like domain-containing protein [Cohnella terricola]TVX96317.1 GyrI-like domain-containing protein [Cohnella terricola]
MMTNLDDIVEARICKFESLVLIGFSGQSMEEEDTVFRKLNERMNEIANAKSHVQYLVVSGKNPIPFVGIEVTASGNVPNGMNVMIIPVGEYVVFKFKKEHIGEFWSHVCTIDNQQKYRIDLSKPRFEIFKPELQGSEFIEWYIPT